MNYFIYTYIISLITGRYELNKMTALPMCGFIAKLVEHRTGIAEVTGSNPVEALNFFQASSFQLLKLENSLRGSFFTFNCSKGFSAGSSVLLPPQKPTSPNSNLTRIEDLYGNQLRLMWLRLEILFIYFNNK